MRCCRLINRSAASKRPAKGFGRGFTIVELLVTMVIGGTLAAMAVPVVTSSVTNYQRNAAVASVTSAIRAARYAAIYQGNTIRLTFTQTGASYQLSGAPTNTTTFTNIGNSVPLLGTLGGNTTLEFHPSGVVKPVPGTAAMAVALTYRGVLETITVTSSYGDISVTP